MSTVDRLGRLERIGREAQRHWKGSEQPGQVSTGILKKSTAIPVTSQTRDSFPGAEELDKPSHSTEGISNWFESYFDSRVPSEAKRDEPKDEFDSFINSLSSVTIKDQEKEKEKEQEQDEETEEEPETEPKMLKSKKTTASRRKPAAAPEKKKYTLDDYVKESYTLKRVGRALHGKVGVKDDEGKQTGATRSVFLSAGDASKEEVEALLEECKRKGPVLTKAKAPARPKKPSRKGSRQRPKEDDGLSSFLE